MGRLATGRRPPQNYHHKHPYNNTTNTIFMWILYTKLQEQFDFTASTANATPDKKSDKHEIM
jgi:hypothetical protein